MRKVAFLLCCCALCMTVASSADTFTNPIISDGAAPWIIYEDGYYYLTDTTGWDIKVRRATRLAGTNGIGAAIPTTVFCCFAHVVDLSALALKRCKLLHTMLNFCSGISASGGRFSLVCERRGGRVGRFWGRKWRFCWGFGHFRGFQVEFRRLETGFRGRNARLVGTRLNFEGTRPNFDTSKSSLVPSTRVLWVLDRVLSPPGRISKPPGTIWRPRDLA
jgi:hypothetical protein